MWILSDFSALQIISYWAKVLYAVYVEQIVEPLFIKLNLGCTVSVICISLNYNKGKSRKSKVKVFETKKYDLIDMVRQEDQRNGAVE